MEYINCILCAKNNTATFLRVFDRLSQDSKDFNLTKCECGLIYLNPRPSLINISKYYNSKHYEPHNDNSNKIIRYLFKIAQAVSIKWKYNKNCGKLIN